MTRHISHYYNEAFTYYDIQTNHSDLKVGALGAMLIMDNSVLKIPRCWMPGHNSITMENMYSKNILLIVDAIHASIHDILMEIM